jgi:hypothetical protein
MDRLAEFIFKVLLFMTTPWFFLYSYFASTSSDEESDEIENETYTVAVGKVIYEFETWEQLVTFVIAYNKEKR